MMKKPELIEQVANKAYLTKKDSEMAVNAIIESISEALADGDKVQLVGFGTFEVRTRKAREGRNPATGDTIIIDEVQAPVFKPGKTLKQAVHG